MSLNFRGEETNTPKVYIEVIYKYNIEMYLQWIQQY
jgi:hypothetical protein